MRYTPTWILFFFLGCTAMALAAGPVHAARGGTPLAGTLPKSLQGFDIRDDFVPSSEKKVGVIHALQGHIVVIHRGDQGAYFGRKGDTLYENDSLHTLSQSRCRIKFFNEDVISMAEETTFSIDEYDDRKEEGKKNSLFSMLKGKAVFYALRLFKYKETRFRLKTPTAVVGVRGTKFGAHVYWLDETRQGRGGLQVADGGRDVGPYLAQIGPGGGGRSFTNCFSEDGVVDVNGLAVVPGEMFQGDAGAVVPTPPGYVRAFESETEVTQEGAGGGEQTGQGQSAQGGEQKAEGEKEEGGEDVVAEAVGTGSETTSESFLEVREAVTETTQDQSVQETENTAQEAADVSNGKIQGEIGAMIALITTGSSGGQALTSPIYGSQDAEKFTGGAESYLAYNEEHDGNDQYKMVTNEQSEASMDATVDYFDHGTGTNLALAAGSRHQFQYFKGGSYMDSSGREYLSWGYWSDPTVGGTKGYIAQGGSAYYAASGTMWQVEGLMTHPDYIDYLQRQGASYTYSGESKGVFGDSAAANVQILSGTFSCQVNFGNRSLSAFDIKASGGPVTVHLQDGSGTIKSDGTFDIEGFGGTIAGHAVSSSKSGAGGTFLGYQAEGAAGNWHANDGSTYWAAGEFHGHR